MDYIKKDIVRQLQGTSEKSTDDEDNDDLDDELTDAMLENHCYHLSWAVFKHLPCNKTFQNPPKYHIISIAITIKLTIDLRSS